MGDKTGIEWTEATWNPVIGCAKISPGCKNCYAEKQAYRIGRMQRNSPYLQVVGENKRWNGHALTLPERLAQPLRWKKPRRIFVNSMSDLFHEDVPNEFIAAFFGLAAATPQHTYQILTKRPQRMREFFAWLDRQRPGASVTGERKPWVCVEAAMHAGVHRSPVDATRLGRWPLPNVWLGVSVEDQAHAKKRIPWLLECPAALRFLSVEPLLGPVDLRRIVVAQVEDIVAALDCLTGHVDGPDDMVERIGWVIVGGESGPGARACDIDWIKSIVDQCKATGVPCFVKQVGARPTIGTRPVTSIKHRKGADPSEWPADLRVQEMPTSGGAPCA